MEAKVTQGQSGIFGETLNDPLQHRVALPFHATFFPLGFSLEIRTNSEQVLHAAAESWECFDRVFEHPPLEVCVATGAENSAGLPPPPVFRGQRHLLAIVADQDNFAVCDYARRFAYCWVSPPVAASRAFFRYYFLEAIVYTQLAQLYLAPIHAACVARNRSGVLLCGESGAGKTSLAFACARRGWTFLSDDVCWLLRSAADREVIGRPHQLRFREDAADLFPELAGRLAVPSANSKLTVEARTADLPGISTTLRCRADHVVFLRRGAGLARLERISGEEAWQRLVAATPVFEPQVHEEQKASLRRLTQAGTFELHYRDLEQAVVQLEALAS